MTTTDTTTTNTAGRHAAHVDTTGNTGPASGPRVGDVFTALMSTTAGGDVVLGRVRADRVTHLGCGCWRLEGDRPGAVFDRACTSVAVRTGCGWHGPDAFSIARGGVTVWRAVNNRGFVR